MAPEKELKISGERIYLRKIRVKDVDGPYQHWLQDPEVTRYLESRFSKNTRAEMEKFVKNAINDSNTLFLAIVLKDGDRHIGNIKLSPINRIHKTAELGILIGEKDCWGKGFATEAIKLLADYAFTELHLHKITSGCYACNAASARAFEKAGFAVEGVRKSQCLCDGTYVDVLLFGKISPAG